MLNRIDVIPSDIRISHKMFTGLSVTQRQNVGQLLLDAINLQWITYETILEAWTKAHLTKSAIPSTVRLYLAEYACMNRSIHMSWGRFLLTCQTLGIAPAIVLESSYMNDSQARLHIIRSLADPLIQATMLLNGWRKITLPYLVEIKKARLGRGNDKYIDRHIENVWFEAGIKPSVTAGRYAFQPRRSPQWTAAMTTLAISAIGIKPATLVARLIELVEQAEARPAS